MQGKPRFEPRPTLALLMSRRRCIRLTTTLVVVLAQLFSQLALAQYVCPKQAAVEAMAAMMEAGLPCDGLDPDQPVLCHQHSADPGRTFEAVKLPVLSPPLLALVIELPALPEAGVSRIVPPAARCEGQPPPDPLFLATLRLRV